MTTTTPKNTGNRALNPLAQHLAVGGGLLILGIYLVELFGRPSWWHLLDNLHWTAACMTAAGLAWVGWRTAEARERVANFWFFLGLLTCCIGQFLWDIQVWSGWNPFPGPSDIFFLCLGPCYAAAFLSILGVDAKNRLRTVALDAGAFSVAVVTITLALYLPRRGSTEWFPLSVLVLYPVVLLAAACLGLILVATLRLRWQPGWLLTIGGLLINGWIWMRWNSLTLDNALADGTWLNKMFSFTTFIFGLGAASWRTTPTERPEWERWYEGLLRLLPLMVVISGAIAVVLAWTLPGVPPVARTCSGIGLFVVAVLAFARQSLLLNERDELLLAQQAVRDSQLNYQNLFETNQDGILLLNAQGCVDCNPSALKLYGVSKPEILGRSPTDFSPPQQPDGQTSSVKAAGYIQAALAGEPQLFEWRNQRKDGTPIDVEVRLNRIERREGFLIQAVVRDITERRKLEEQLRQSQKLEAIGKLSGGVAHDFNNLLTVIDGNLALLSTPGITAEERAEHTKEISGAVQRASELTRQLLLFSRKKRLRFSQLELNATIQQTGKLLQRIIGEDIVLQLELGPNLPPIRADGSMVDQIVFNLTVNARDAMPRGGRLMIQTSVEMVSPPELAGTAPSPYVCLTVRDSGSGIAPQHLPHIFEPFFTTKEVGKGTGLGLAMIYGIVQEHQGWITVSSPPGAGATFKVYFPAAPGGEPIAVVAEPPTAVAGGKETILVVEDEAAVRKAIRQILSRLGYQVLEAENGPAALALWSQQPAAIDLVITDVIMPGGMTGYEVANQLRQLQPLVKILYISGYTGDTTRHDTTLIEGANFIQKPFQPAALAQAVRRKLDKVS